jgi:hypothetical protein
MICSFSCSSRIHAAAAAGDEDYEDLGAPELGLPLVLCAGELAAALQPGQFRRSFPAT